MRSFFSMSRLVVSFFAFSQEASTSDEHCRSNSTHIVWKSPQLATLPVFGRRRAQSTQQSSRCDLQLRKDAEKECLQYLSDNIMIFDTPFRETMGFPTENTDSVDGLDNGMVGPTVKLALDAKTQYPWTDDLPKHIFFDYVLNYANLNEARSNWRPLLVDGLKFNESDLWKTGSANMSSVVTWVNKHLWTRLGRTGSPIVFKSSQTPLIFDPMSTIAFGYASCTGTSILFCNALRAVGVPARVAGTPAWYGNVSQGNHNWVEVFDEGTWKVSAILQLPPMLLSFFVLIHLSSFWSPRRRCRTRTPWNKILVKDGFVNRRGIQPVKYMQPACQNTAPLTRTLRPISLLLGKGIVKTSPEWIEPNTILMFAASAKNNNTV